MVLTASLITPRQYARTSAHVSASMRTIERTCTRVLVGGVSSPTVPQLLDKPWFLPVLLFSSAWSCQWTAIRLWTRLWEKATELESRSVRGQSWRCVPLQTVRWKTSQPCGVHVAVAQFSPGPRPEWQLKLTHLIKETLVHVTEVVNPLLSGLSFTFLPPSSSSFPSWFSLLSWFTNLPYVKVAVCCIKYSWSCHCWCGRQPSLDCEGGRPGNACFYWQCSFVSGFAHLENVVCIGYVYTFNVVITNFFLS